MKDDIILGIDPGTNIMGYAILKTVGKQSEVLEMGVLKMTRMSDQSEKLSAIFEKISQLIKEYQPGILAIEAPFLGKNPQSMLKLGRAQGVAIGACLHHSMQVYEYPPRKIKQAITGNGNASKEQVATMLRHMMKVPDDTNYLDATDALAAAVCHLSNNRLTTDGHKFYNWESFIAQNKDRIISKSDSQPQNKATSSNHKFSGWENFIAQNKDRIISK